VSAFQENLAHLMSGAAKILWFMAFRVSLLRAGMKVALLRGVDWCLKNGSLFEGSHSARLRVCRRLKKRKHFYAIRLVAEHLIGSLSHINDKMHSGQLEIATPKTNKRNVLSLSTYALRNFFRGLVEYWGWKGWTLVVFGFCWEERQHLGSTFILAVLFQYCR